MDDQELLRYSRHILLEDIGIEGQERIKNAHALIIGAGGLGAACAPYLVASGIGILSLVDDDVVDLTNLQRQIIYCANNLGQTKVSSAEHFLQSLNPNTVVKTYPIKADQPLLENIVSTVDVVIDCTDNYQTRHLINQVCVTHKKPLVFGAALQFDGQFSVFDSRDPDSACYACLFSPDEHFEELQCSQMGVFSPLVGIIGAIQAANALQVIIGFGKNMLGKLGMWDAKRAEFSHISFKRNQDCKVCGLPSKAE